MKTKLRFPVAKERNVFLFKGVPLYELRHAAGPPSVGTVKPGTEKSYPPAHRPGFSSIWSAKFITPTYSSVLCRPMATPATR